MLAACGRVFARRLPCESGSTRVLGLLCAVVLVAGCTFEGYVPKGPPPKPLADSEMNIADLAFDQTVEADLDCPEGRCRVRYRLVVPRAGKLTVRVDGPKQELAGKGPRLARVVIEGAGQQTLAALFPDEPAGSDSLVGEVEVTGGVHYVLIQGIGGHLEYRVHAGFEAGDPLAAEPVPRPMPDSPPAPGPVPGWRSQNGHAMGDLSDGADFAFDPSRNLNTLRKYAFAQDPAALLKEQDKKLEVNPFVQRQAQREVRYALADMGFDQVPSNQADFLVSVHGGSTSSTWYSFNTALVMRPYDAYFEVWRGAGMHVRRHTYQDGTLIVDFIDAKTGELIWHGWTTEPIAPSGDRDELLAKAVRAVLAQF